MLEPGEEVSERDLARMATLHVESIDDSIPSLIGGDYARHFYRFLANSDREWIFCERVGGDIASVCVVSLDPDDVYMRTVRATFPHLALQAVRALFTRPKFRRFLGTVPARLAGGDSEPLPGPEIAFLFTAAEHRSRKLGQQLINRVDTFFRSRGQQTYYVQTIDAPDNRALAFYDRNGFERIGRRRERGHSFIVFQRHLSAS